MLDSGSGACSIGLMDKVQKLLRDAHVVCVPNNALDPTRTIPPDLHQTRAF